MSSHGRAAGAAGGVAGPLRGVQRPVVRNRGVLHGSGTVDQTRIGSRGP